MDTNKYYNENFPKGCCFFLSALSAERKKKLKLSVLCALNDPEQRRRGVGGKKPTN
jgi:hypothetical protein